MAKKYIVDSITGMKLVFDQPVRDFLVDQLEAEIKRLRAALQQVWDCEEYNSCPDCKLLAREALEPKECDHLWGTRQGGFLVHCGKCGAIKQMEGE